MDANEGPLHSLRATKGGPAMSHHLMRIATLAIVTNWAIALSGPAFGQVPPLKDSFWDTNRWHGSASCTVTGHSPSNSDYHNQEIHKWEIIPSSLSTWYIYMYYWANWTVVGSGSNADFTWTTNGYGQDLMQFWVPEGSSQLNIANLYADSPITDPSGITVRSRANGTYSTASVTELTFP